MYKPVKMHVWILTGITFLHYADNRSIGCTQMNEKSSRSHTIFSILLESRVCDQSDSDTVNVSCLVRLYGGGGGGGGQSNCPVVGRLCVHIGIRYSLEGLYITFV